MSSFWQRISMDTSNAMNDVYSHYIIGDDAGKSMLLSYIVRKQSSLSSLSRSTVKQQQQQHDRYNNNDNDDDDVLLGMTFIELNGRAYVKSVIPGSGAYNAGIVSQDAIQLAIPIRLEWEQEALSLLLQDQQDEDDDDENLPINNNNKKKKKNEQQQEQRRIQHINSVARTYGYRLEKKGARTSYNQLYYLLQRYYSSNNNSSSSNTTSNNNNKQRQYYEQYFVSPPKVLQPSSSTTTTGRNNKQQTTNQDRSILKMLLSSTTTTKSKQHRHNNHPSNSNSNNNNEPWDEPPTPSKFCEPIIHHRTCTNHDTTLPSSSTIIMDQQNNNNNTTTTNNHIGDTVGDSTINFQNSYLNFDRKRSSCKMNGNDSAATENDDDLSIDDIDNDSTPVDSNNSNNNNNDVPITGILFILRRTRQRQVVKETSTSLCIVPSNFRMDDECDVACSVLRRLAPTSDMELPIPDTWEELVHDSTDWLLGSNNNNHNNHNNNNNNSNHNNTTLLQQQQNTSNPTSTSNYYSGTTINDKNHADSLASPFGGMNSNSNNNNNNNNNLDTSFNTSSTIPLDAFEQKRTQKLAALRARITAETMLLNSTNNTNYHHNRTDDVEAATVRAMIQKAVGLAFVRASKVVLGVSIHGGSGIVISRLPDGTWSAPSAIGTWGIGLGIQFGLEVAEYIFILQTQEAMEHFKRGESYTVGGNMGIAIGGLGREAYGAASVAGGNNNSSNMICGTDTTTQQQPATVKSTASTATHDEEYNDEHDENDNDERIPKEKRLSKHRVVNAKSNVNSGLGIAPIVAYAKSQGLYIGVSLEGSRIFTRNDINCRTYKFTSGKDVTAHDILSGMVPTPPEAEELYAALHSVEFTHEMSRLPRPPDILRKDSANAWTYDRSILVDNKRDNGKKISEQQQQHNAPKVHHPQQHTFSFFDELTTRETDECTNFEAQFKNFLYGGVSVQRIIVDTDGGTDRTSKERRTLWLMLPEIGSLRIGFVSKISDGEGGMSNKSSTQRARRDDSYRTTGIGGYDGDNGTVGSEELTLDSALITKDGSTTGPIRQGNVKMSERHSVALTDVVTLSQEPPVQMKFRGEDKTQHLRVISIQDVSGANLLFLANNFREAEILVCGLKLLLERETARLGVRGGLPISALGGKKSDGAMSPAAARGFREISSARAMPTKPPSQSTHDPSAQRGKDLVSRSRQSIIEQAAERKISSHSNWGQQPGRDYMRGQASPAIETTQTEQRKDDIPIYVYGQSVVKGISKNIRIPLPIPLCRVLLLDSTSPVITQWQKARGDSNFDHSQWVFPPATPRELERHASEHQLIASGSMSCAERTASFDRLRYGSVVRLSETYTVDSDDPKKMSLFINENSPRRGFAVRVKISLRVTRDNLCEATAFADVRPVGKDMSNQAAVHKAFNLVFDEIKLRYGTEENGLLGCFLSVVDGMASNFDDPNALPMKDPHTRARSLNRSDSTPEEKKSDYQSSNSDQSTSNSKLSGLVSFEDMLKTGRESPEIVAAPRPETPCLNLQIPEANPAKRIANKLLPIKDSTEFTPADKASTSTDGTKSEAVLIEVKPLPKIRLALMPSPREEDEETSSSKSPFQPKQTKKKKKKRSSSTPKADSKHSSVKLSSDDLKRHMR